MGRIGSILFNRGQISYIYDSTTGLLSRVDAPSGNSLNYTYDGSMSTGVSWQGEVNGSIGVRYDNDFKIVSRVINDIDSVEYQYDRDGLMTQVGALTISRDSLTGRITGTTLENVTTNQSLDNIGNLTSYQASFNGSNLFNTAYERDSLGRIERLTETIEGATNSYRYGYDTVGRLERVWKQIDGNDSLISLYSYDTNGNRVAHGTPTKIDSGYYDAQDRMSKYGNALYYYTANGDLRMNVEGTDTTQYAYDAFGNLVKVVLPSKDIIEYIVDGSNRRIGRKLNGVITNRWIYTGQLHPIAELDSAGNIVARFEGSFMVKNGNTYRIVTDHLGSIRLVVDVTTGNAAQRIDYDEFGNVVYDSNPAFQPFGYAGGIYDQTTKLVRFGARDYDANVGRWTTKDPVIFRGKQTNIYSYVGNNPINKSDRRGLGCDEKKDPKELTPEELIDALLEAIENGSTAYDVAVLLDLISDGAGFGAVFGFGALDAAYLRAELQYQNGRISSDERYAQEIIASISWTAGTVAGPEIGVPLESYLKLGLELVKGFANTADRINSYYGSDDFFNNMPY